MYPYAITRDPATLVDESGERVTAFDGGQLTVWQESGLAIVGGDASPRNAPELFLDRVAHLNDIQPVVPMQASDEPLSRAEASRLLRAGCERFTKLLARFDGCAEWSIRIDPPVLDLDSEEESAGVGRSYLETRRKEFDRQAGVDPGASRQAALFTRALLPFIQESRVIAATNGAASLVMLVRLMDAQDLQHVFSQTALNAPCACALSGPWPPFSFVSLAA